MKIRKDGKAECRHILRYNAPGETEKFLGEMSEKGWIPEKTEGNTKFIFRKSEPQSLRFSVNIFSEGSIYDTHLLETNEEYIDYCEEAGWKFLCASGPVHIFCTDRDDTPEIDSDPAVQLKTINRFLMKNKIIPGIFLVFIALIQIVTGLTVNLYSNLKSAFMFSNIPVWGTAMLLWIINTCHYFVWYCKAKKAAAAGEKLPDDRHIPDGAGIILLAVFAAVHCGLLTLAGAVYRDLLDFLAIPVWIMVFLIYAVIDFSVKSGQKNRIGRDCMKVIHIVVIPAVSVCFFICITVALLFVLSSVKDKDNRQIISDTSAFSVGKMNLTEFTHSYDQTGAFIISEYSYTLRGFSEDDKTFAWNFKVTETKSPKIHSMLLENADGSGFFRPFGIRMDISGAQHISEFESDDIVCLCETDSSAYRYLICDSDTIAELRTYSELTEEQFKTVCSDIIQKN